MEENSVNLLNATNSANANAVILLVEDNESILTANRDFFVMNGYEVICAATLAEAETAFGRVLPDIVVLDILMPDGSGFDFCVKIREDYDTPIFFLTALTEKNDIIKGLRLGGDDYLVKPYDIFELLARVEALLRRSRKNNAEIPQSKEKILTLGSLRLDYIRQRAYSGESDLLLKIKEFSLLGILAETPGEYINSDKLYDLIWGKIESGNHGTLWVAIAGIRKRLAEKGISGEIIIEHKRNSGYRLIYTRST